MRLDLRPTSGLAGGPGTFLMSSSGIVVSMTHVENALHRKQLGTASDQDVVLWATMILLNEAFDIDEADNDHTSDCLNDFSFGIPNGRYRFRSLKQVQSQYYPIINDSLRTMYQIGSVRTGVRSHAPHHRV